MDDVKVMAAPAGTPLTASTEWAEMPVVDGGFEVAAEPWHYEAPPAPYRPNRATRRKREREARRARRG